MLRIVIIGSREDILPFKAVGAELFEADSSDSAGIILNDLGRSENSHLVVLPEEYTYACKNEIAVLRKGGKNVIVPLPLRKTTGIRLEELRKLVSRSLGVDLLGNRSLSKGNGA